MQIYLIPSAKTSRIIKQSLSLVNFDEFKIKVNRSDTAIWNYLHKKSKIPIHVIEELCKISGENLLEFLEGEKIVAGTHSNSVDIFSTKGLELTPYKSLILGCIPTEAHLRSDAIHIEIAQNTNKPLLILKSLIEKEYPNVNRNNLKIEPRDSPYYNFVIKSPFLRWLFQNKYKIDEGRAARKRRVPLEIASTDNENLVLGFLGGAFSLEGCFSVFPKRNQVSISLEMASKEFIKMIRGIFLQRGYTPTKIQYDRGCWCFDLNKIEEITKLMYEILPWFIHVNKLTTPRKVNLTFVEIMKTFIDRIYLTNEKVKELVCIARNKIGSSTELIKYINKNFHFNLNLRKANRWIYERGKLTLRMIFVVNKLLGNTTLDLFKNHILPDYYSLIFYVNVLLTKQELEEIRKQELLIQL